MNAYGYVRTPPDGSGLTAEEQSRALRGAAMAYGTELARIFVDEYVPGWMPMGDRPAGAALCAAVESGDLVFVGKLHRMFRSAADALATAQMMASKNVGLIVVDYGPEPVNLRGAAEMFFRLLRITAEFERERLLEQPIKSRAAKSLQPGGKPGSVAPFGYRITEDGRALVEEPDEQEAIKTMIRLRPEMSLRKISEEVFKRHAIRISHEGVRQVLADYENRLAGG